MRGEADEREQTRLQARVYCLAMPRKTAFPAATCPREPSLSGVWAVVDNAWEMKEWQRGRLPPAEIQIGSLAG